MLSFDHQLILWGQIPAGASRLLLGPNPILCPQIYTNAFFKYLHQNNQDDFFSATLWKLSSIHLMWQNFNKESTCPCKYTWKNNNKKKTQRTNEHLPQIWKSTRDTFPLEGIATFYEEGGMFDRQEDERVWGWNSWPLHFLMRMRGQGVQNTCFTFSGAGSCKWLTSRGVMRGTVWNPSSTEGGLVPFSPGLPFSFTILMSLFPDLRQAVGGEAREREDWWQTK